MAKARSITRSVATRRASNAAGAERSPAESAAAPASWRNRRASPARLTSAAQMNDDVQYNAEDLARWRNAAEQGDAEAQYNLGEASDDWAQAEAWYRRAAEQGHADAQCSLGVMYHNGSGVAQDDAQAVAWFRMAAEQGDAQGQLNLGTMYLAGQGVARDDAQADAWLRKAVAQDPSHAATIGTYYEFGLGVEQDDIQAAAWYRMAADLGDPHGQFSFGYMCDSGRGVSQDGAQAEAWYSKAVEQGHPLAPSFLAVKLAARGSDMLDRGDFVEALELLRRATELDENNAGIWHKTAYAYSQLDKWHEAADCANRALSLDPQLYQSSCLLAMYHYAKGDTSTAKLHHERVRVLDEEAAGLLDEFASNPRLLDCSVEVATHSTPTPDRKALTAPASLPGRGSSNVRMKSSLLIVGALLMLYLVHTFTRVKSGDPVNSFGGTPVFRTVARDSNIRTGPGTEHASHAILPAGTRVEVAERDVGQPWLAVKTSQYHGYVRRYLLADLEAIRSSGNQMTTTSSANLRIAPSTASTVRRVVPRSTKVRTGGEQSTSEWLFVVSGQDFGFMHKSQLRLNSD